ncbi:hypothetical protein Tco_0590726 [Tanacetum coccineum]
MGYLVRAYYNISPTRYYKDDPCWSADLKSKTTEDIISIGSFVEVLVLNQYVLVRKILIMSSITAQQTKIDLEIVPKEKRLEIGKCNGRLNPGKKQREPTFQVVLDALALTSFYYAFLTTTDVLEVYMHQFWDSIHKYENSYRFRMDKKKKFKEIVSFFKEIGHTREIKSITDVVVDQMHQPCRTFATIINRSLSGKTTSLDKLRSDASTLEKFCNYHQHKSIWKDNWS